MAITIKKYVNISSGINNSQTATEKELIARIFTASESLTPAVVECSNLADVAEIFATTSDEYKIAAKYFAFINQYGRNPQKISFAKDTRDSNTTITDVFETSYQTSNNFATFMFLGTTTTSELSTLAGYISTNYPTEFMMIVPVTASNYETVQAAVASSDGVSLELCGATEDAGKYNFYMPMAIAATTDYNKENGTVTYMFNQSADMKVVVDNDDYEDYDSVKVNYYGQTQKSGQKLAFYQNGVLQGKYQDQNVFVNEIWLKDALITVFMNFMLVRSAWFYNNAGRGLGQAVIMDVVNRAKLNGTITTEKELTESDKNYIYNNTSDENAWRQIYQEGYYLTTWLESKKVNNQDTKYFCYKLIYSKGDMIKAVAGTNILI